MIVFYSEHFTLDLSNTKITLIEENAMFYDYLIKKYSLPFTLDLDELKSIDLGFLEDFNAVGYQTEIKGHLLIENDFEQATLVLRSTSSLRVQGMVYYGKENIELFDTPLSKLDFPVVEFSRMIDHAKEVISKQYPQTGYNFPMILDSEIRERSNYEKFQGVINNYDQGNFLLNSNEMEDGKPVPINRNVMVPYPYLMEILRVGFASEGYKLAGSFVSDKFNEKILVITDHVLEKFYSGLPDGFSFDLGREEYKNNTIYSEFRGDFQITQKGNYEFGILLNIPTSLTLESFHVKFNDKVLYQGPVSKLDKKVYLAVTDTKDFGYVEFVLKLSKRTSNPADAIGSIKAYNSFDFSFSEGQLNEFPKSFSLSQVMPDISFGGLLNAVKNTFNLEVLFSSDAVYLNYIEEKFTDLIDFDESMYEVTKPKRFFNSKAYVFKNGENTLVFDKRGEIGKLDITSNQSKVEIEMEPEFMRRQGYKDLQTSVKSKESKELRFALYDGLQNGYPVTVETVFDRQLDFRDIYNRFWSKWTQYRVTSQLVKDKFSVNELLPIGVQNSRFKYNARHLYKKIKKTRRNSDTWEYDIESEMF